MTTNDASDRLIRWLATIVGCLLILFVALLGIYFTSEDPPTLDPANQPHVADNNSRTLEIHRVGPLPEGFDLTPAGDAILKMNETGERVIVIRKHGNSKPQAQVAFHSGDDVLETIDLTPQDVLRDAEPQVFNWAVMEIADSASSNLEVHGEAHILRDRHERSWLFVPRPNQTNALELRVTQEHFKPAILSLSPEPGSRESIHYSLTPIVPPLKTVEIHRPGALPEGIEWSVSGNAIRSEDDKGHPQIVIQQPDAGPIRAVVTFRAGEDVLASMALTPDQIPADENPPEFDWGIYELKVDYIPESVPLNSEDLRVEVDDISQLTGQILRDRGGRIFLIVPCPNGEDWVKLLVDREGYKQAARLIRAESGRHDHRIVMPKKTPSFENFLPNDVVLFVNASDYGKFKARLNELRGVQLCRLPAMEPFVTHFLSASERSHIDLRDKYGMDLVNLCAAHTGQICFSLRYPEAKNLLIVPKGKAAQNRQKQLLSEFDFQPTWTFLSDVPGSRKVIQDMLAKINESVPADMRGQSGVTDQDVLYAAPTMKSIQQLLEGLNDPPDDPFAANPRLQNFRKTTQGPGDFEVFVDLKRLINLAAVQWSQQSDFAFALLFGLGQIESAGLSFSIAKDDFDTECRFALVTSQRPNVFDIVNLKTTRIEPESWVPADVMGYYSFNWNLDEFFLEAYNPSFRGLGDRLTIINDLTESRGFTVPRVIIAWDSWDETLKRTLLDTTKSQTRILDLGTGTKVTIHVWDAAAELTAKKEWKDKPLPFGKVAMTEHEGYLMVATHVELLEKILKNKGPMLADSEAYQRVARHFPKECGAIVYQSPDQNQLLFQALKTGELPGLLKVTEKLFSGLVESLDGSKLPEYQTIKHFFQPSGGYAIMDDAGIRYTHFSLKGDQHK